jgi:cytidine kinase
MSLLVVGSVALDTVKTPFGERQEILGGAASYFAVGASLFTRVRLVGVIGQDFPEQHVDFLRSRDIDLAGLTRIEGGKTFRWTGRYVGRMECAETLETQLNVLGDHRPPIPEGFLDSEFVLLANDKPDNQLHVAQKMKKKKFMMMDTMNLWIEHFRDGLERVLRVVDGVVLNDEEARSLGGDSNLITAMRKISAMGPGCVLVKKGEHGSILHAHGRFFALPAYPLEKVHDPTGAGDTFAAGVMGYLAQAGDASFAQMKRAMVYGTVLASYNVEDFGLDRLRTLTWDDVAARHRELVEFLEHGSN